MHVQPRSSLLPRLAAALTLSAPLVLGRPDRAMAQASPDDTAFQGIAVTRNDRNTGQVTWDNGRYSIGYNRPPSGQGPDAANLDLMDKKGGTWGFGARCQLYSPPSGTTYRVIGFPPTLYEYGALGGPEIQRDVPEAKEALVALSKLLGSTPDGNYDSQDNQVVGRYARAAWEKCLANYTS